MKITKSKLKQLIHEVLTDINEGDVKGSVRATVDDIVAGAPADPETRALYFKWLIRNLQLRSKPQPEPEPAEFELDQ